MLIVTAPVATSVTAGAEPAIRHVQHIDARHLVHQLTREMLRAADAAGRVAELAGVLFCVSDEIDGILDRHVAPDHDHVRHDADERNRNEIAQRVVAKLVLVEVLIDGYLARCGHQKRLAVRGRLRDRTRRDRCERARAILNDDRLAEFVLDRLAEQPRHNIDAAARRIADEHLDRTGRIPALRVGARGSSRQRERSHQRASDGVSAYVSPLEQS